VPIGSIYTLPMARPNEVDWSARLGLLSVVLLGCLGWQAYACALGF
jgi:hypothetical protein